MRYRTINSGKRGFTVTGSLGANQTWQADTIPYIISAITIPAGKTLTVNPGAKVKFENEWAALTVEGTLKADGGPHAWQPIYFTSIKDDAIGGDTNADSSATTPAAGDWYQITTGSGGIANFGYSIIRYGGFYYGSSADVYNNGGTLNIATSSISNASYGISHAGGTTNVIDSVIRNNSSEGFHNTTTSTTTATNNYWGALSGPYNALYNPSGAGNAVSNYVSFNPWLGTSTNYSSTDYAVNNGKIRWDGSTQYTDAWNKATSTWSALGAVEIVAATSSASTDLTLSEVNDADLYPWPAWYDPNLPHALVFNSAFFDLSVFTDQMKQATALHEFGHALGLEHSYWENVMYYKVTSQTTLGTQDVADYNYCWVEHSGCP